ncbi:MAG: SMP-30/gluconolactonase/LRE family protein [Rhodospirillales bacterium]|nr:SMP-30/gluconolactonase/LRE family protein [Rhodospirillales bacterium]
MAISVDCILRAGAQLGECPVWSPEERSLYWVDIPACKLNRFDPSTGINRSWTMPAPIGSFVLRRTAGAVVALRSGFFRIDFTTGETMAMAEPLADNPACRFNDGRCDRAGRFFWAGTMEDPPDPLAPQGELYRFGTDRHCVSTVADLIVSNGLAFSPDGRTMYLSDSHAAVQTIWTFDYDHDAGIISNRRVFATTRELEGRPDGAAIDADGCYWTAANGGWQLIRFTPDGRVDRTIPLPVCKPTMLCFGGPDLDTIYVTSMQPPPGMPGDHSLAGCILALAAGVRGLPEPRFIG